MKKSILKIALAGIWITFSEFLRNELIFKSYWVDHFQSLGLEFKTLPVNGIFWMVWSFLLAYVIYKLMKVFSIKETIMVSWIAAFVMMWITVFNLQVLPLTLLIFAVPLSLVEVGVGVMIIKGGKFRIKIL
jgi:hypothetical protein